MKKYFLNKMSTGKRLAKRSIIGMRVCALGEDGLFYPGRIHAVKTPASPRDNQNCINLTPNTRYSVRFDTTPFCRRGSNFEFSCSELIGDGFGSIIDVRLRPGQKVFVTHNGRETTGVVVEHDVLMDEVTIEITPSGESSFELVKKLDEVRLSESRRSPRLADQAQDTDFARLADMAGDRRRSSSYSIDVPMQFTTQHPARKRRTSFSHDEVDFLFGADDMDECNAALVLMSLSCSPNSPRQAWCPMLNSPGDSIQSYSSGSSSPHSCDDGNVSSSSTSSNVPKYVFTGKSSNKLQGNQINLFTFNSRRNLRTTSLSTSDEGIVMDYSEEIPRKRRNKVYKCTWKQCGSTFPTDIQVKFHVRSSHLGPKSKDDEDFYYTDLEEEDEAIEIDGANSSPPLPPTLSHSDMARPPHEDPEYQRQFVGNMRQGLLMSSANGNGPAVAKTQNSGNNSVIRNYAEPWSPQSPVIPIKHMKMSPRPSTSYAPYPSPTYSPANYPVLVQQYHSMPSSSTGSITKLSHSSPPQLPPPPQQSSAMLHTPTKSMNPNHHQGKIRSHISPGRRTRGENKKCRKVYGMDNREQWCTQCKWKKACSRFNE